MNAFGKTALRTLPQVPTPVGKKCLHCEEHIVEGDSGVEMPHYGETVGLAVMHLACFMRSIFCSVGHQRRECPCFGGSEEDPPGMSRRDAAEAAYALIKKIQQKE